MNISEFERNKPKKTYKIINDTICKYEKYMDEIDPVMNDVDAAFLDSYQEILKDLINIKKTFLSGS